MIDTVLGPIAADALGAVSMHEHVLSDARVLHKPAREPVDAAEPVTLENLGVVRWNLLGLRDNLVLDDPDLAISELARAAAVGQRTIVELSSWGLGPRVAELAEISRASGVQIVVGCGAYLGRSHPEWLSAMDETALEEQFCATLREGFSDTGIRAGLLGVVGTSEPIEPAEWTVVRAAGRAAARTGAAVAIRLDPAARRGLEVLAALAAVDCPPERVIFCNVDEFLEAPYLRELAGTGANLEWCFGNEAYYGDHYKDPTDAERMALLVSLLDADDTFAQRCVLGCSVWTKSQLRRFGGMGYEHLLRRIVPQLERRTVPAAAITAMLTTNPARLLDRG